MFIKDDLIDTQEEILNDFSKYENLESDNQKICSDYYAEITTNIDKSSQITTDVSNKKEKSSVSIDKSSTVKNTPLKIKINLSDEYKEISTDEKSSKYEAENIFLNKKRSSMSSNIKKEEKEEEEDKNIKIGNNMINNEQRFSILKNTQSSFIPFKKYTVDSLNSQSTINTLSNQTSFYSNSNSQIIKMPLKESESIYKTEVSSENVLNNVKICDNKSKNKNEFIITCSKVSENNQIKYSSNQSQENEIKLKEKKIIEPTRKVPIKTLIENDKNVVLDKIPNLHKLILTEKLKRDFFGINCKLTLEQMLKFIKIKNEKEKNSKSESNTKNIDGEPKDDIKIL